MDTINFTYWKDHLPKSLLDYKESVVSEDISINYDVPTIHDERKENRPKPDYPDKIENIRIPARINNPLIPYPLSIAYYAQHKHDNIPNNTHVHHRKHIVRMRTMREKINKEWGLRTPEICTDINTLKSMSRFKYSNREDMIHQSSVAFARRATINEMHIMAKRKIDVPFASHNKSESISLLIAIQRLRIFLGRANKAIAKDEDFTRIHATEPEFKLFKDYSYIYGMSMSNLTCIIIASGGHFSIYHSECNKWFTGPITYLDYIYTVADILNNIVVIMNMQEYTWIHGFIQILVDLIDPKIDHNLSVDFVKSCEALMLLLSDYDENYAMNWGPIIDITTGLWKLDQKIINEVYDYAVVLALISGKSFKSPKKSPLCNMIIESKKMNRNQLQEVSSLHKFIFYAEVNAQSGVMKFLKRVHTKRPIDPRAVKNITRLAKQEFYLSYYKKHTVPPNCIGNQQKISWLQIQLNKNNLSTITSLNLAWWDDITIFNCMDNTLTDDALEFAKDKGALKNEIHFGPGDSRKELLQVIEQENYVLKDLMAEAPFPKYLPRVVRTTRQEQPIKGKYPARLIEKEREQKIEARLFANAELSNKHGLSVVATKMKKALSYFSEQLMTPSDKQRKLLVHRAAQSLKINENYSLLLDIEGHNQSMQYENTAELAEFFGHLFGETNWSEIPNYFTSLDVFHYDEHIDEVIWSQGQYGGIEGWLNPLWTAHTMFCVKLLRNMTDLQLITSMTYSDDVNAIFRFDQISEATLQASFQKIMSHFIKFGMIVKMSQTNMSKHRVTILRQHYADGIRSDSSLKKLISTSGANNAMIVADSLEVAGISSSIASALELSTHVASCTYLKNYKIGLLLARLPQMILSHPQEIGPLSMNELPVKLSSLLYSIKDEASFLLGENLERTVKGVRNDIAEAIGVNAAGMNRDTLRDIIRSTYGISLQDQKFVDQPDRLLYLQVYDPFIQDLLFFWAYIPESLGGLGGSLSMNLILSGHSSGFSKAIHYLFEWIKHCSSNPEYFTRYLDILLTIDSKFEKNLEETRILTSYWPGEIKITSVSTSISASIKSMIKFRTKNKNVLKLFKLQESEHQLKEKIICIFRDNYHQRIAQFYYENTSVHFLDLLVNKIETSSGLLSFIKSITRLRNSACSRVLENIRIGSIPKDHFHSPLSDQTDIIELLLERRQNLFPKISMIMIDEPLYDDKISTCNHTQSIFDVRQCSPMHFSEGYRVFDDPILGNEVMYKGELLDDDRMVGNKEELLAAKVVAVTKWILTKFGYNSININDFAKLDVVMAANVSLMTLTGQDLLFLWNYSPNEVGGEILHRIPNMRFNNMTYIRSDMMRALRYTVDLNQSRITSLDLVDSNVNFEYVTNRILLMAMIRDTDPNTILFRADFNFSKMTTFVDVQFIKPKISKCLMEFKTESYAEMRGHKFSKLRYRHLATYYLTTDDMLELSLIPKVEESADALMISRSLMQELIYNYSRALDRDLMIILPSKVEEDLWSPLSSRLDKLDSDFAKKSKEDKILFIKNNLLESMSKRQRISMISKHDTLKSTLQTQCLRYNEFFRPRDDNIRGLIDQYSSMMGRNQYDMRLSGLLAKCQNALLKHTLYKDKLAVSLISEHIITYHFETIEIADKIVFDYKKAYAEFVQHGISAFLSLNVNPELATQMLVLGMQHIELVTNSHKEEILLLLDEISSENAVTDILQAKGLPSLSPTTKLTGLEELPSEAKNAYYESYSIPYSAMESFHELEPLVKFTRKCVEVGADPHTFDSLTGSDSYVAQYGLFQHLKEKFGLDQDTKICDLTAGRGDSVYAARDSNLRLDSYGLRDIFTSIMFHPLINYDKKYDIFDTKTLKFLRDYEWVHIDVSFTGKEMRNILDLLLTLEELNVGYSIRVNSISISGYTRERLEGLPMYDHYLSSPVNSRLKPYQIYLIGVPGSEAGVDQEVRMKSTPAFRSIALSYSRLMSPHNRFGMLSEYVPNSVSVSLVLSRINAFDFKDICRLGRMKTAMHYIERYHIEVKNESIEYIVDNRLSEFHQKMYQSDMSEFERLSGSVYPNFDIDIIGDVKHTTVKYHVAHLKALQDKECYKLKFDLHKCTFQFLTFLRSNHPISFVRRKCNVMIMLRQLTFYYDPGTPADLEKSISKLNMEKQTKPSIHQTQFQLAIKLIILSSYYDDYQFGINYCHTLLVRDSSLSSHYIQVLKMYKLMGYLYDEIKILLQSNFLTRDEIETLRIELVDHVLQKIKSRTKRAERLNQYIPQPMITEQIEIDYEKLFADLGAYAEREYDRATENLPVLSHKDVLSTLDLKFDLNISSYVDKFIADNPNIETNQFGQIMLGDDIEEYDPDD